MIVDVLALVSTATDDIIVRGTICISDDDRAAGSCGLGVKGGMGWKLFRTQRFLF